MATGTFLGATILLSSTACAQQDNTAPNISAPRTVATRVVADAGSVTPPPVVLANADGQAKIYNAASTAPTVQTASVTTGAITFHDDADQKASHWVANKADRVAVSIRYGGATTFKPEDIQGILEHDFAKNGVGNAVFFWEHGGENSGTSIAVETDKAIFGPYALGKIREEVPEISKRIKFNNNITHQASLN